MFAKAGYDWEQFDEDLFLLGLDVDEQDDFFDSYDPEESVM